MKKLVTLTLFILFFVSPGFVKAHEGHHDLPGTVQSPHGGFVDGTHYFYIELVQEKGGKIKLYPLTKELHAIRLEEIAITATSQIPRKKKAPVQLKSVEDHWEAVVDSKGSHRYTLELSTLYQGKKDKIAFQVEP